MTGRARGPARFSSVSFFSAFSTVLRSALYRRIKPPTVTVWSSRRAERSRRIASASSSSSALGSSAAMAGCAARSTAR